MCGVITDIQKARTIIGVVGTKAENQVINLLLCASFIPPSCSLEYEKVAAKVVSAMENEYVLKTANRLWDEKYDEIPDWIKEY